MFLLSNLEIYLRMKEVFITAVLQNFLISNAWWKNIQYRYLLQLFSICIVMRMICRSHQAFYISITTCVIPELMWCIHFALAKLSKTLKQIIYNYHFQKLLLETIIFFFWGSAGGGLPRYLGEKFPILVPQTVLVFV